MSKFVIECPNCGKYVEASNSFFAKKKIPCECGHIIDVKTEKLSSKVCPHCGNTVVYDQSKGDKAKCPICHEKINTLDTQSILTEFTCPTCSCRISADKNAATYTCPLCGTVINVQTRIAQEKVKKEGIVSVIKYEGGDSVLVWKHPVEDFNLGSQLIVHESQEALFVRDGKVLDLFGAGRYTLATQNLPILENLYKLPTNSLEYFHSEVYFINTSTIMGLRWGTDSKVRVFDPASGLHVELGASGEFNLRVANSRKLLLKVVGTTGILSSSDILYQGDSQFAYTPMLGKFRALIMNKVKTNLAKCIRENAINVLEIDEHMDVLSTHLQEQINLGLQEYGLVLPEFYITNIVTPDDDPNFKRLKQQHADKYLRVEEQYILKAEAAAGGEVDIVRATNAANVKKIEAEAEAAAYQMKAMAEANEMKMKGYSYQDETARQVGVGAVTHDHGGSGSNPLNDVAGLGISLGVMNHVIGMTKEAVSPISTSVTSKPPAQTIIDTDTWDCSCGAKGITGNFCSMCGAKRPVTWDCSCGMKGITGNFCSMCGAKRPVTWDCSCGMKGITGNFCSVCGAKRQVPEKSDKPSL